ncbi:hypothetical protein BHE74_00041558 [Ensete ventricosum]|nr:hypothetical protein BHE74_00041558 [Ensete ventricosum]
MALRGGVLCAKSGLPNPLPSNRSRRNAGMRLVSSTTAADADRQKRPQNVEGEFFVDCRCIDCDTCRWMAPVSALVTEDERHCFPVRQAQCILRSLPRIFLKFRICDEKKLLHINSLCLQGIYHCGYHSERSYGATSYLITHPEGNILVDRNEFLLLAFKLIRRQCLLSSPRFTEILARNIERLGGVRYMFLTHKYVDGNFF